jgi:uncharacterized lipoprotein YddW (UPF0748 family)
MKQFGVWMWPDGVAEQGAQAVGEKLTALGITDVFLLTKGLAGRVCCADCTAAPVMYPDRDVLGDLLAEAHARGIKLHAWFTSSNDAAYKADHPLAGNAHFVHGRNNAVIRMADAGYAAYMESVVADIARQYPIDGIHLDYIRFNHLLNGWAEEDLAALRARGVDIAHLQALMRRTFTDDDRDEAALFDAYRAGDADVLELARSRRGTVVAFASRLLSAARAQRPGLIATAALMPEGAYPDLAFSDLHYGQNYRDAAALYDYVVPMAYRYAYHQDAQWVQGVTRGAIGYGNRVLTGVQAYDSATPESVREDMEAVAEVADGRNLGACLFRFGQVEP